MWTMWLVAAHAGPAHVERVGARHDARELELLQRTSCRPGVQEQAVARYLDQWGHLDTRPVRRVEAWGAELQGTGPVLPEEPPPLPEAETERPLAVPVP